MIGSEYSTIAEFIIQRRQYLDAKGTLVAPIPKYFRDPQSLVLLYKAMRFTRAFDTKAISLQRTGRLGTYASSLGQEAVSVGVASAMHDEDVLIPSYRETGAMLWRGVLPEELLLYWGGDERGSNFRNAQRDFPISVPVGSQAAHAAGVAYSFKLRNQPHVAVCMFGDGATSKGDVYESLNFAGVWKLPVIFVVSNNQWAISVSRDKQTSAETLAQKAISAGIHGEQIDGNDIMAVRTALEEAILAAREGQGARLIEAITYRLSDHTTADDASRYRHDDEVSKHWNNDPISRLRNYLVNQNKWQKTDEEELSKEIQTKLDTAVQLFLESDILKPESMFEHLYDTLPHVYNKQYEALKGSCGG